MFLLVLALAVERSQHREDLLPHLSMSRKDLKKKLDEENRVTEILMVQQNLYLLVLMLEIVLFQHMGDLSSQMLMTRMDLMKMVETNNLSYPRLSWNSVKEILMMAQHGLLRPLALMLEIE